MPSSRIPTILVAGLAVLLASCGAATVEGAVPLKPGATAEGLHITTTRLPDGQVEGTYPVTQLVAVGGSGPLAWKLSDGTLPRGVTLSDGGLLRGVPAERGLFTFSVTATDGVEVDARDLVLAVETFAVVVGGLRFGEAWSESPLTLDAVGADGACTFEVVRNESGGAFDLLAEDEGRAVWIAGAIEAPCTDVLRVMHAESGAAAEVELTILPHPAAHLRAEFGTTDVWYVDPDVHNGVHGMPRDWDEALRMVGLRSDASDPTTVDELADLYVRRTLLLELGRMFGRETDGSRGDGLGISFPLERPGSPYVAPASGTYASAGYNRYSVIALAHGTSRTLFGAAFGDGTSNGLVENNSPSGTNGELGVFVNRVAMAYNAAFQNNTLPARPIEPADEAVLRDLLHGRPVAGDRATFIRRAAEGYARAVATLLAHEIGHSLGLRHTSPVVPDSVMNSGVQYVPGSDPGFLPSDREQLRWALPGPDRTGTPAEDTVLPAGGIDVVSE